MPNPYIDFEVIVNRRKQILRDDLRKAADVSLNAARRNARKKTGNLRSGFRVIETPKGFIIRNIVHYAVWQDRGTRFFRGTNFMRKGLEAGTSYLRSRGYK